MDRESLQDCIEDCDHLLSLSDHELSSLGYDRATVDYARSSCIRDLLDTDRRYGYNTL